MAISERSFRDRQGRGQQLHDIGHLSQLRRLNSGISTVASQLINAREDRRALYYDGEASFQAKFLAIKEAVAGGWVQSFAQLRRAMRMPSIVLCLLLATILAGRAGEYSFHHMTGVTGLGNVVFDAKGKETTIIITKDSDAVSLAVLDALLGAELYGTEKPSKVRGAFFDQPIVFIGEFTSEEKRTPVVPNGAPPEPYRDFKITGIKVGFPFYRFVTAPKGNQIDGPFILEAHFGFDSLMPDGIKHDGSQIDLSKHTNPPKDK